jgi:GTPase SAR1 family protein
LAQEPFTSAEGVLLLFSMNDRASFDSVRESWAEIIHRDLGQDICVVLVGNVYGNENSVVSSNEARMLAEECQMRYYEVDVRKSEQVEEAFMGLLSQVEARKDQESGNIQAYMNAFKGEMFAYMEEMSKKISGDWDLLYRKER